MGDFTGLVRSSMERDLREKSQSDERSISQGVGGGQWTSTKGKVAVEVEGRWGVGMAESLKDVDLTSLGYQMRPKWGEKFSSEAVREVIKNLLVEYFQEEEGRKLYDYDKAEQWVEHLNKQLCNKVRQLNYPRYKIVTHITLGEHIGGGIHVGMKCIWDADTDLHATYTYLGDNLFCVGTVCGVYTY